MKQLRFALTAFIVSIVLYSGTLSYPLQWDDLHFIAENPFIKSLSYYSPSTLLGQDPAAGTSFEGTLRSRTLGYLSFALNYRLHGLDVRGYHAMNILIHALTSACVFALLFMLLRHGGYRQERGTLALAVACLFAAHPLQTEAVTYVFQRLASLAALLYIASLTTYVLSRESQSTRVSRLWFALSVLLALMAVKTKENAATLPLAIALVEWTFLHGILSHRLVRLIPYTLCALIVPLSLAGVSTADVGGIIGGLSPLSHGYRGVDRWDYLLSQGPVVLEYLKLSVYPVGQSIMHKVTLHERLKDTDVLVSLGVLSTLFAAAIWSLLGGARSAARLTAGFGILWFFITLSIESSIIPIPMLMNEYRMYLPSVGLLTTLVVTLHAGCRWFDPVRGRDLFNSIMIILIIVLSIMTVQRNMIYRTRTTLWEDTVNTNPESTEALVNLGNALRVEGLPGRAVTVYDTALSLDERHALAHLNLGLTLAEGISGNTGGEGGQDLRAQAAYHYMRALQRNPGLPQAWNNLGNLHQQAGRIDEAIAHYRKAIELDSTYADAYSNLGALLALEGRYEKAETALLNAVRLAPESRDARLNLAAMYFETGRVEEGKREAELLRKHYPGDPSIRALMEAIPQ